MTILTATMIDHLIAARNRITDVTAEYPDFRAVDHIDAVLREVPQGDRPDVDELLGRKRIVIVQHADQSVEVNPAWIAEQSVTPPEARAAADEQHAAYTDWTHGELGAGCAGNDSETCEAGGWG